MCKSVEEIKETIINQQKEDEMKKFNGCNKKELASVLRDNNISYDEISDNVIGFDFNHLMEEVYSLPKIVISKLVEYLNDRQIDITGIFYYETKNEDGCTNKEDFQNIINTSLISLTNIKYELKNIWKMTTLAVFFSEKNNSRVNNILCGRVKWNSQEEYDNILFFKTGNGIYHPSIAERYLVNVDLFNNASDSQQKALCKKLGIPTFILDKILYDDMPLNLTTCDLLLNAYNEVFFTSYKLRDFCKEKDMSSVAVEDKNTKSATANKCKKNGKRKSPSSYCRKYSVKNIPQEIINGFPKILDKSLTLNRLSVITGVPYSTITRMLQKMESNKDHYLSLVDNTPIASAEPESSDSNVSSEIDNNHNVEYPYAQPIIYDEDMFKEVKTPSHKSSSSEELDLEMFSRFTPEYLRSVSEYLNILADLKDAENRSKAIQSKLS